MTSPHSKFPGDVERYNARKKTEADARLAKIVSEIAKTSRRTALQQSELDKAKAAVRRANKK